MNSFSPDEVKRRIKRARKNERIIPFNAVGVITMVFVLVDLYCVKSVANVAFNDGTIFAWLIALTAGLILDVPMALAGAKVKGCMQGLYSKKETIIAVIISVCAFATCVSLYINFRMKTNAGIALSDDLGRGITSFGAVSNTLSATDISADNADGILAAKLLIGMLPIATSLASFAVGILASDPLRDKLRDLEINKAVLIDEIITLRQAVSEGAGQIQAYANSHIALENDFGDSFMRKLSSECAAQKQLAYSIIMEYLKTANSITATENAARLQMSMDTDKEPPASSAEQYIMSSYS